MPRCQCIEVLSVLNSNRKEVLSFLTSHCKEVLALYDPRASDHKKSQEVAVLKIHTWYIPIADENESRAYHANRYDKTQNRFEYRRKRSIGTSSALARNETHLVSLETSLERNESRLARRW